MERFSELSRRGFVRAAALSGAGAAALSLPGTRAVASPLAGPATATTTSTPTSTTTTTSTTTATLAFTAGTNASVTASPAGDRLIIEVQGVLWSLPPEGGTATALSAPGLEPTRPAWSPDGSSIAVCAYQGGGFHLWTMAPDGSRLRQLTSGPWDDRGVAWAPDGRRVAFSSERGGDDATGGSYNIWTLDTRSGELTRLTGDPGVEDYDPTWHPDGDRVLFVRAGSAGGGGRTLASVPAGGGAVTVERTVDTGTLVGPAVSSDGRVACVLVASATGPATPPAVTLLVDGEPVTHGEDVSPQPPSWTSDGTLFYVADGRVRVRRPGREPAGTAAREIRFSASLDVPRPRYRRKT
ncbi:TolB family protein [Streptomyces scopuliridis]|uniref:TolB family protein n=1 Tax=Streptomyces scopuliridis TaxID=452529 RepID=UPI0036C272F8